MSIDLAGVGNELSMITARAFQTIRRRVMMASAVSCGFQEQSRSYLRECPTRQRHCIDFEAKKYGHGFTVDLGFHYAFVPWFSFGRSQLEPDRLTTRCCFEKRLRKQDGGQFFEYGETREEAEVITQAIIQDALLAFASLKNDWGDGRRLLTELPPKVLEDDAETFAKLMKASTTEEQGRLSDEMRIRQLLPGWFPHVMPVCLLLGYLSIEYGQSTLVPLYISCAKHRSQGHIRDQFSDAQLNKLARLAKKT